MILVLGFGNTLRGDDGFGPAVIAVLEKRALEKEQPKLNHSSPTAEPGRQPLVQFKSAHQLLPEDAALIAGADQVIFVDACIEGKIGSVSCADLGGGKDEAFASTTGMTHALSPTALLALAGQVYGHAPPAIIYTAAGECFDLGEGLSPPVQMAVEETVRLIAGRLAS